MQDPKDKRADFGPILDLSVATVAASANTFTGSRMPYFTVDELRRVEMLLCEPPRDVA